MKSVLILSLSDLERDPRVNRQIRLLAGRFRVTAAGYADPRVPGVEFVHVPHVPRSPIGKALAVSMLKLRLYEKFYWSSASIAIAQQQLAGRAFDLVLANDLTALPLACSLDARRGVLYDAHEYSPREFEDSFVWRFLFRRYNEYLCRRYLGRTAAMTTVCVSIADEYRRHYGVAPKVVYNAPPYHEQPPSPLDPGRVRMVHHGAAIPSRRIEVMIELMDHLDVRFHLDLMLVPAGDAGYIDRLRRLAAGRARVRFVDPVPMPELPRRLNHYDVGLFLLPPTNFNYRYALPNKLFEFLQARLAVAIGPSPEMARVVREYDCGVVADDFSPRSLAQRLSALEPAHIARYKERAHAAAADLSFEKSASVLLAMVDELMETSRCAA